MNKINQLDKKFNDLINRSPSWKIYLVSVPIVAIFIYIMFRIVTYWGLSTAEYEKFTPFITLKISFMLSLVMSVMITLMFRMSKESEKFWDGAKELEKLIDEADTRDKLQELYQSKFMEVHKLSSASVQYSEVKRLKSLMEMKYKLIK